MVDGGEALPFVLIAADAVEQVENRISLAFFVHGRCVDVEIAGCADGFGLVGDDFEFAAGDILAWGFEILRWWWEEGFVVGSEFDLAAEGSFRIGEGLGFGGFCGGDEGDREEGGEKDGGVFHR